MELYKQIAADEKEGTGLQPKNYKKNVRRGNLSGVRQETKHYVLTLKTALLGSGINYPIWQGKGTALATCSANAELRERGRKGNRSTKKKRKRDSNQRGR